MAEKRLFRKKHTTLRKPKKDTKKIAKSSADSTKRSGSIDSSVCVGVMLAQQQDGSPDNGESMFASSVAKATSLVISSAALPEGRINKNFVFLAIKGKQNIFDPLQFERHHNL